MLQKCSPPSRSCRHTGACSRNSFQATCGSPSSNMSRSQKSISSSDAGTSAMVFSLWFFRPASSRVRVRESLRENLGRGDVLLHQLEDDVARRAYAVHAPDDLAD